MRPHRLLRSFDNQKRRVGYDPDEPIIFHLTDMSNRRDQCGPTRREHPRRFVREMSHLLRNVPYTVITVFLSKESLAGRAEWKRKNRLALCSGSFRRNRCATFLRAHRSRGDIMPESRGKRSTGGSGEFERVSSDGLELMSAEEFRSEVTVCTVEVPCQDRQCSRPAVTRPSHRSAAIEWPGKEPHRC